MALRSVLFDFSPRPGSARYMLARLVQGKLLYCSPPPGLSKSQMARFIRSFPYNNVARVAAVRPRLDGVGSGLIAPHRSATLLEMCGVARVHLCLLSIDRSSSFRSSGSLFAVERR